MKIVPVIILAALSLVAKAADKPNFIIIFIDDMGYADIGPFGARDYPTPNLDQLAVEGRRFTDFMVSAPVCSASRSALMTGAFHVRVDVNGAYSPKAKFGLNPNEMTIAELCKQKGYATAITPSPSLSRVPTTLPLQPSSSINTQQKETRPFKASSLQLILMPVIPLPMNSYPLALIQKKLPSPNSAVIPITSTGFRTSQLKSLPILVSSRA